MEICVILWCEIQTTYVMISYLCKYPACNPNDVDDDYFNNEDNFCAKR